MEPPFLELSYYVGRSRAANALHAVAPDIPAGSAPTTLTRRNLVGTSKHPEEAVTKGGVVLLRTEGDIFCGPPGKNKSEARDVGQRAYRRFLAVAELVSCIYGAILVEYSLEEPDELARDARTFAFRNFYLGRAQLPDSVIREVLRLSGSDSYVELCSTGVYVSMSPDFNPSHVGVEPFEAQSRSARIGAVIGRSSRKLP